MRSRAIIRLNEWAGSPWRSLAKADAQVLSSVCMKIMPDTLALVVSLLFLVLEIRTVRAK